MIRASLVLTMPESICVLLVDDERDFVEATAKALRRRGFEVYTASDGPSALSVSEEIRVDTVVLDIKMPGLSGEQVLRELRRRWPDIAVVILTGHGTVQQAFRTADQAFDYLTKPCDIDELAMVVRAATGARGTTDRSRS